MHCRVNAFNCHPENDTGNLVSEPLPSSGRLIWFQYFGFQAASHNMQNGNVRAYSCTGSLNDAFVCYFHLRLFPAIYRWFREQMGQLRPVTQTMRVTPSQDVLHIRHVSPEDAGRWVCRVSNQFGEQRLETQLTVTAQLSVHVQPQLQVSLLNSIYELLL
jgi:hypothetical protein